MIPKYLYSSLGLLALAIWSWLLGWPEIITNVCLFMAALFAVGTLLLSIIYYVNLAVREALQYILHRDE
jgi:hypothetical protein